MVPLTGHSVEEPPTYTIHELVVWERMKRIKYHCILHMTLYNDVPLQLVMLIHEEGHVILNMTKLSF